MYLEQAKKFSRKQLEENFDRLNRNEDCLKEQLRKKELQNQEIFIQNVHLKVIKVGKLNAIKKEIDKIYRENKFFFNS